MPSRLILLLALTAVMVTRPVLAPQPPTLAPQCSGPTCSVIHCSPLPGRLTLIDTIPSSPIVSRFGTQYRPQWYILAQYDW